MNLQKAVELFSFQNLFTNLLDNDKPQKQTTFKFHAFNICYITDLWTNTFRLLFHHNYCTNK